MKLKRILMLFAAWLGISCLTVPAAVADISIPTSSKVSFTLGGRPYSKPVSYTVTCHGQMVWPTRQPDKVVYNESKVFSYSADCKSYPCEIDESFYMNYRRIDSCDIEGSAGGKHFQMSNFASSPSGDCSYEGGGRTCNIKIALPGNLESAAK